MTVLPIVERELRVATRRRMTYWLRVGIAVISLVLCLWTLQAEYSFRQTAAMGRAIFSTLTTVALAFCLLAGVAVTADAISKEKREGTLGLLFLTDLNGYDIVLGKLFATSLNVFYGLIAIFPILALSLLFGGVTGTEFWRMTLVLLNSLFFSLAVGLLVSALSRQPNQTMGRTLGVIGVLALGPLAISFLWHLQVVWLSPLYLWGLAYSRGFSVSAGNFWLSLATTHVVSWIFLAVASLVTPHSWKEKSPTQQRAKFRERVKLWRHGNMAERGRFRARLLDVNAVFWLAARDRFKPWLVWLFLGLVGGAWIWGRRKYSDAFVSFEAFFFFSAILHLGIKFWAASEAGALLAEARQNGTLETLLSTPLTVKEIVGGHFLALKRQFAWPVLLIIIVESCILLSRFRTTEGAWLGMAVGGIVFFVLDLWTIIYVAMWLGLKTKQPGRASLGALTRVVILPWGIIFFFGIFGGGFRSGFAPMIGGSLFIRGLIDFILLELNRGRLHEQLRTVACGEERTAQDYDQDFALLGEPTPLLAPAESHLSTATNVATSGR